ncbi:LemA family protein [Membranicola marinus]|uniref:LemA family protein n=1 Tax=Membranihabitans marinus TaxID=1227546 RepID=A0A953LCB7_9BACT|nr:LemA family protein [Membranihabitans marinus]MBY5957584.1 LemA family protein [Membranihabitans marinus]
MKKSSLIVIGIIVVLGLILYNTFSGSYNSMVTMNESVESAWSTVETQYQRRADLYSSVVSTIKGSAEFEQETLNSVIEARSRATSVNINADNLSPEKVQEFQNAQEQLSGAFSRLLVSVERYPDIKSTQAFRDFQTQIEGTENRINKARKDFNDEVQTFNTYIKQFPRNLMAGLFGFEEKGYFKAQAGTENVPEIDFG